MPQMNEEQTICERDELCPPKLKQLRHSLRRLWLNVVTYSLKKDSSRFMWILALLITGVIMTTFASI